MARRIPHPGAHHLHDQPLTRELERREILVDYRPGAGIRVAPHFYTGDEELAYTVDAIREIAWQVPSAG